MSMLVECAANYYELGFHPIPLISNQKKPSQHSWPLPIKDVANELLLNPDSNLAVAVPEGYIVLDIDLKSGKDGFKSLKQLEDKYSPLPAALTQKTPHGEHRVFKLPEGVSATNRVDFEDGLDIRASGGYIVVSPSTVDSGHYSWIDFDVLNEQQMESQFFNQTPVAPEWLLKLIINNESHVVDKSPTVDVILEGNRNDSLFRKASGLRGQGLSTIEIDREIQTLNQTVCNPPLPYGEVTALVKSASKYPPNLVSETSDVLTTLNDAGNANRLVSSIGKYLRYVSERKEWLVWIDGRWQSDSHNIKLNEYAQVVAKSIYCEASLVSDSSHCKLISQHANSSQNMQRLNSMISLAQKDSRVAIPLLQLDANKKLLGVANGVVDLNTGELIENKPEMLITKFAPVQYDKEAKCPMFIDFLKQIFNDDQLVISYVQRMMGYCLTGLTSSQVLFFFYGTGANGKSTLLNVIEGLLGKDLCKQVPAEVLVMKKYGETPSNGTARLHGTRVAMANELPHNSFFNETVIKQLTGEDTVAARFLFKEHFDFKPEFKLIIVGNHKPVIQNTDNGIWRRIHMLDFPVSIPEGQRDLKLNEKLKSELSGILNFAIVGCLECCANGLQPPQSVIESVEEYRADMDVFGSWLDENIVESASSEVYASKLYENYKEWADINGFKAMSSTAFGRLMKERGYLKVRDSNGFKYKSIKLIAAD